MKTVFKAELHKMLRCPALWGAILIGMIACGINVVENCQTAQPWLDNYLDGDGTGYSTLSIFANWIDGLQVSLGEAVFFTIFPLLAAGEYITPAELPVEIKKDNPDKLTLYNQEAEKATILRALESSGNNKSKAAQMLGIDRKTLYNKMKLYHIGQDE